MAPGRYVQGPGALDLIGAEAARFCDRAFAVCDAGVHDLIADRLRDSFARANVSDHVSRFSGEPSPDAIDRLAAEASTHRAGVVIGLGGGRAIDTAKAVAWKLEMPFISVPTTAATDAAAARGIAIYDESHRLLSVEQLARNPDCVLADTALIAHGPVRFLRAGLGEALSKAYEVEACLTAGALNKHGTQPLSIAGLVAAECRRVILAHGEGALAAADRGEISADLEAVVEGVLLLGCLAFENGGLSIAHAVAGALGSHPKTRQTLHGEHVAYGTLVQVAFEDRAAEQVAELRRFCRRTGLPTTLAGLGMADPATADIDAIVAAVVVSPFASNHPRHCDASSLRQAIDSVERSEAVGAPISPKSE